MFGTAANISPPSLSVIVPCCNEEENVLRYPSCLISPLRELVPQVDFIFIDDGSTDETYACLQRLQMELPSLRILQHSSNRGLGAAIRSGIEMAQAELILTMDADLTFDPRQISLLMAAFGPGVDCVMGSPARGKMVGVPFFRQLLSYGVNFLYQTLLPQSLTAVSSLFRLYRRSAIAELPLKSDSFDINAEILVELLKRGRVVVEVPVVLTSREKGESKIKITREIKHHLRMFWKILNWRFHP